MAPDLHTPLENLLLFQTLQQSDGKPPSFSRISESLKSNGLLQESDSFERDRLGADSLERNYLRLLKEEVKLESQQDKALQNGDSSPRKRKRSSPLLETVDEALRYAHLLPQLTNRLYFRYRDDAIKSIEEEERRYRSLQGELQELERGERDARSLLENTARRNSRGVSSIQTLLRHDDEDERVRAGIPSRPTTSQGMHNGLNAGAQTGASPSAPIGFEHDTQKSQAEQSLVGSTENHHAPFLPPPQHVSRGYSTGSPSSDIHRRLPPPNQVPSHTALSPSTRSASNAIGLPERASASPIILPPPPGMLGSSASPTGPLDALADMAGQQYRASPSMPSPRPVQHPGPQQHPHQLPQGRYYMPRPYPHNDTQPPYQAAYPPYVQGPLQPANYQYQGAMPPYQGSVNGPAHGSPYGNVPPYQSPIPPYTQHPGYGQTAGYYQHSPVQTPYPRGSVSRFQDLHTPMSGTPGRQGPSKPTPITTSASSTRWKNVDASSPARQPSPRSPSPGAVSPISEKALTPSPEVPQPRTRMNRSQKFQIPSTDSPTTAVRGKGTRGRGTARRYRGGRTASAESSAHADSTHVPTRSQSVVSQADELSIDHVASTRKIKPEPYGTSFQEDDASTASHTADESVRKSMRQRRGTLQRPGTSEGIRPSSKRKREESAILPPPSPVITPFSKPGFVLGTRNFSRTSTNLMNDILAHKLGSMFSKPLTEREAPGYKNLIYRPQDLKSIKAAINAGNKALLKAAENVQEVGTSVNVWVPETPDVVPPKGIVNSAQLEKELMRMFANAIMFNPDVPSKRGFGPAFRTRRRTMERGALHSEDEDEGEEEVIKGKQDVSVVKDTREMFEAVEKSVAEWRSAERAAEEGGAPKTAAGRLRGGGSEEVDELAGDGDDVVGSVEQEVTPEPRSKRRRRQ